MFPGYLFVLPTRFFFLLQIENTFAFVFKYSKKRRGKKNPKPEVRPGRMPPLGMAVNATQHKNMNLLETS